MKLTMRDKVFQLIGKYQSEAAFRKEKLVDEVLAKTFGVKTREGLANPDAVKLTCYLAFLDNLKWILEEDDSKEGKIHE